jgi:hypothetical protein
VSEVEYVEKLRTDLEQVHAVAREHIKCRSDKQKKHYDLKSQIQRYEECDLVWMHNPAKKKGICPKLTRSWEGPYLIVNRLSDVTYRVRGGLRAKLKVVHFDRLKPYLSEAVPEWVKCELKKRDERNRNLAFKKEMETAMLEETIIYDFDEENDNAVNIPNDEKADSTKIEDNDINKSIILEPVDSTKVEDKDVDKPIVLEPEEDQNLRRSKRTIRKPGRYLE